MLESSYPMELVMYAGNDFIASVSLNPQKISWPGYVGHCKRRLIYNNSNLLQSITDELQFLLSTTSMTLCPPPVRDHVLDHSILTSSTPGSQ